MTQARLDFDAPPTPLPPYRGEGIAREASRDGAVAATRTRETECALLLKWYGTAGAWGLTDPELQRETDLPINVITARRNDLIARGRVVRTTHRRENPKSGVRCVVWVLQECAEASCPSKS